MLLMKEELHAQNYPSRTTKNIQNMAYSMLIILLSNWNILHVTKYLEPVCCKKQQKKVPDQLLVCGKGDLWRTWRIPNWFYMYKSKLIPLTIQDQFYTIQNLQRFLIPQTSDWSGTFLPFLQKTSSNWVRPLKFITFLRRINQRTLHWRSSKIYNVSK